MKKYLAFIGICLFILPAFGQENDSIPPVKKEKTKKEKKKKQADLNLTNALIIAQLDNPEDRYSLEINLTDLFTRNGVKAIPSLNMMKLGSDALILAADSTRQKLEAKGIDTYMLVSVRGYDRRFKVSQRQDDLATELTRASLFDLYRMDIVSISFEFKFYREGQYVYGEMIKCGNISDIETVLKRFRSKVQKRLNKKWKAK